MQLVSCGRGGIVQLSDGEALHDPAIIIATAPDSPPDL